MKSTDIALLLIIVSITGGLAFFIGNQTFGATNDDPIPVFTVQAVDGEPVVVDEYVFSEDAINPTVDTNIEGEDLTDIVGVEPAASADDSTEE